MFLFTAYKGLSADWLGAGSGGCSMSGLSDLGNSGPSLPREALLKTGGLYSDGMFPSAFC